MTHEIHGSRAVAQTIASVVGVVNGFLLTGVGLLAVSNVTSRDTWLSLAVGACGVFTLLPLSILGLFKPRPAAYGITSSLAVFLGGSFIFALHSGQHMELNIPKLTLFCVPPGIVAALFAYSSRKPHGPSSKGLAGRPAGAE